MISEGAEGADFDAGGRKGVIVSEPFRSWTDLGAESFSTGGISEVAVRTVEDARPDASDWIEVSVVTNGVVALFYTGVGDVVDVERNGHVGSRCDVGTVTDAGHVGVQFVELD